MSTAEFPTAAIGYALINCSDLLGSVSVEEIALLEHIADAFHAHAQR